MAQDTFLRDWILKGEKDVEKITRYLSEIQNRYGTVTSFFVSEKTKTYYHASGILKKVSPDEPRDLWYYRVRDMKEPFEINVDVDMANRDALTIFINYKTFDYEGKFIGATGVGLTVNAMTRLIEEYQDRYGRAIYFCDRSGKIVLAGSDVSSGEMDLRVKEGIAPLVENILAGTDPGKTYYHQFQRDGEMIHLDTRFIPDFGWFLVVEQGEGEAIRSIRRALFLSLLIGVLITIIVPLLIYLSIRNYERRLEIAATTDSLTGIFNRLAFEMDFDRSFDERGGESGESSLLLIDIDHFKEVNDTFSHMVGDHVIRHITAILRENIREGDAFGRWGGEEFIILLKDFGADRAFVQAERLRQAVEASPYLHEETPITVTISIGVASCRPGQGDEKNLFAHADRALHRAKENGRNRTERYESL